MRKHLLSMRGSRWSAESGSIYRALRRLEIDALIHETGRSGAEKRQRIEFGLTVAGELVLQSWLERTPDRDEFEEIHDPIRTRAYFLGLLSVNRRLHVVRNWAAESKSLIENLRQEGTSLRSGNDMHAMAQRNLLMQTEARHDWLRKLTEVVRSEVAVQPKAPRSKRPPVAHP